MQPEQQMQILFNPSDTAGLRAQAEKWGISPAAVARRIVRQVLREHGVLDRPQRPPQTRQHSKPQMVHRTVRLTPTQAAFMDRVAGEFGLTRSQTVRALIGPATRQPITRQHQLETPSHKRTVRWSVRLTTHQNASILTVAERLGCSQTDATAALLASAQKGLQKELTQRKKPN